MANWTVKQVSHWLKANGFDKQVKIFKAKNIDGSVLMRLTENDISQLFLEANDDGTIQESTIGVKSRFRTKLIEWKSKYEQENRNHKDQAVGDALVVVPTAVTDLADTNKVNTEDQHEKDKHIKKTKKKDSDNVKRDFIYLIDDEIHVQFFKNPKFPPYLINYIKQETFPIEIEIKQIDVKNADLLHNYTIKLTETKEQTKLVRNLIKRLFKSIKSKSYNQTKVRKWLQNPKSINIIQHTLDNQSDLFTVCHLFVSMHQILKVYYFDNDRFNSPHNFIEIDNIIQNQITQATILLSSIKTTQIIELIDSNTHKIISKDQVCQTKEYNDKFQKITNYYKQDNLLVSVIETKYVKNLRIGKDMIEIFGYKKLVDEALQKLKNLIDIYRLRKFELTEISSAQHTCLVNFCSEELNVIEKEFENDCVEFHIRQNHFYAPQYIKNEVESRIKTPLSNLQTSTFKSMEFYYNIAEKLSLNIKKFVQEKHCYCELKIKTKLKSYHIPRADENTLMTSKSIIEQSDLFCSSSLVLSQIKISNGTIEILIGDIASQKVDVIIIPSTSFGLKESLIERAGEIFIQQPSNQEENENNSIPFITETSSGRLNCKKILFVNWSLPTTVTNDDYLSESIRLFISKSIQYIIKESKQLNFEVQSIAFAVPDSCKHEQILAEEMIEETIHQITSTKSPSLKVSFILLSDQQTLHQQFINAIQTVRKEDDSFGVFYYPASIITTTLTSSSDEYLTKYEKKITNYLKRSVYKAKLNGFQHWNQYMINTFYKYSTERCVLPKIDDQQQIMLYGPINNVYEVNQKYQLTNALIQEKTNLPFGFLKDTSSIRYKIMLSYSPKDSIISHRLANRLIEEGFAVWIDSNPSTQSDRILRKIKKSDCVILCISKDYFQDEFCEKEAKYADELGKYIIPIKVQNYQPIEWLQKLIEKEFFFQLFGSENLFNLEYDKLLLKILQYVKPGYISLVEQTSTLSNVLQPNQNSATLCFLLSPEQRKLDYEKFFKKLMKLDKRKITSDTSDSKDNGTPVRSRSTVSKPIIIRQRKRESISDKPKINQINSSRNSIVSRSTNASSEKKYEKPDDSIETITQRKAVVVKRRKMSSHSENSKLEFRSKFAKQLKKNEDEFRKFCEHYENSSRSSSPRKIHVYPTAIFGPCPFSDIEIKPRKSLQRHNRTNLPLKFPWNGVFDTEKPQITWTNPSIFFFFDTTSPEKTST